MFFEKFGRSYHLRIKTADDLENAVSLDEAHWVATGAPAEMFNCDEVFLKLLDSDSSGRILCHQLKDAVRFCLAVLKDRTGLTGRSNNLKLDAIDSATPQGQKVLDAAAEVLEHLRQKDSENISLDQVRSLKADVESTAVSEAGVVLPKSATDPEVRRFISDIISTVGGADHPSGAQGVDTARLDDFLHQVQAWLDWKKQGKIPAGKKKTDIMPLGNDTPNAYHLFAALRGKLDQYFAQCLALSLDERFARKMGFSDDRLQDLDFDDPAVIKQLLQKAPLAGARPDQTLNFNDKTNPYYTSTLEAFRRQVIEPVLGENLVKMAAGQWQQIKSFFVAHDNWVQGKSGTAVEPLGQTGLEQYLKPRFAGAVNELIAEKIRTGSVLDKVRLLEKVLLFQLYLIDFANNFVSFPHLYDPAGRAMFEVGSLVMDGRKFNLAIQTGNYTEHKAFAANSNMYVLYLEVTTEQNTRQFYLALPVTSGGKGNLSIGKRGVFYPCVPGLGRECDARVIDIIENPISFREALMSPFQRLGRALLGKIESVTSTGEKKLTSQVSASVEQLAAKKAAQTQPNLSVSRAGLVMGAGVTLAALASALAYITKTLAAIRPLKVVLAVLIAAIAVMLPISIVALIKLRRRDLSAILEGSGSAINARTLSQKLTGTTYLPAASRILPKFALAASSQFRYPVLGNAP